MSNVDLAATILAGALALAVPLTGPIERRIYRSDPDTPLKLMTYGTNIILLWALTGAAVGIDGWGRLLESPVAGAAWPTAPTIVSPVLGVAIAVYFAVALTPLAQSLRGLRWRKAYAAAVRRGFAHIPGLLPNTAVERAAFALLSLTAGLCEEVLYRGFLIRFLHECGVAMPLVGALAVSALVFGLAHAYQGFKGVVGTTIGGLSLGLMFLLSGSLIPGIVVHALMDLQMVHVLRPFPDDRAAEPT